MDLLRFLALLSMKHNFFIRDRHVRGVSNAIADSLSRFQVRRFRELAPLQPSPPLHPAFPTDSLRDEVLQYANWGLAFNSSRSYISGEKRFIQFCFNEPYHVRGGDILSASEGTLIYFPSYLARSVRHGTIKLYLAAVCNLHICCGHGDPYRVNYY